MEYLLAVGSDFAGDDPMRRTLERQGFQILTASEPEQALKMVEESNPCVMMVSHHLGDSDGLELLKQVRSRFPACEVILVTPGGEMEVAIEALRAGALDYLRMPLDLEQLNVALGRARERRQGRRLPEPPSILLLEDHEQTRVRLASILKKEGFRVSAGSDGEEGARMLEEMRFDLVIADMKMPRKDGLTLLRESKALLQDTGFIVMTGYGDEEVVVQALREGAANFLRKPLDLDQMLLAIRKELDHQTTRRSLAYRNRDIELMQELVVRLTRKLEIVVETPSKLRSETLGFLHKLVNSLPLGLVVVDADRSVIFANRHVVERTGSSPAVLAADWLSPIGLGEISDPALQDMFTRTMGNRLGTIETLVMKDSSFVIMTPLTLVGPDGTERYVAVVIRGDGTKDDKAPAASG
ncbi:MAG: response regulator [Deltaproteobacteria bacterium]|nr:response regulator [Deltaproteobacteria bacterium]